MKINKNSGITASQYVVAPEFSLLLSSAEMLDAATKKAFEFAGAKERKNLLVMRQLLNTVHPKGIKNISSGTEQVEVLTLLNKYFSNLEFIDLVVIPKYGNIQLIDDSNEYFSMILDLTDHMVINMAENADIDRSLKMMAYIAETPKYCGKKYFVIASGATLRNYHECISNLSENCADVCFCNESALRSVGFYETDSIDFYGNNPLYRGRSIYKTVSINAESLSSGNNRQKLYSELKEIIAGILDFEIRSRYILNSKGIFRQHSCFNDDSLSSLGLLFENCISQEGKTIKPIFGGGTERDSIYVTFDNTNAEDLEDSLIALSAACRTYDGLYPISVLPFYSDFRKAVSFNDTKEIIDHHTGLVRSVFGYSSLELKLSRSVDFSEISGIPSLVSLFFRSGGMMIDIKRSDISDERSSVI